MRGVSGKHRTAIQRGHCLLAPPAQSWPDLPSSLPDLLGLSKVCEAVGVNVLNSLKHFF